MEAKKYLKQLMKLDEQIKQKQKQVDELREMRGNIGSFDYSKERVQSSGSGKSQVEESAVRLLSLENEVKEDIIEFVLMKDKIIKEIHQLADANHIKLLYKRYVEFKRLEEIAVEMHYTYIYTRELHGDALNSFQNILHNPTF